MITVKTASNEIKEVKNWAELGKLLGMTSPASAATTEKKAVSMGWSIIKVDDVKSSTPRQASTKASIIDLMIKDLSVIDHDKIKALKNEREYVSSHLTSSKDAERIMAINDEIMALSSPVVTYETMAQHLLKLYNEYELTKNLVHDVNVAHEEAIKRNEATA